MVHAEPIMISCKDKNWLRDFKEKYGFTSYGSIISKLIRFYEDKTKAGEMGEVKREIRESNLDVKLKKRLIEACERMEKGIYITREDLGI